MAAKKAGTELVKSLAEFAGNSKGFDRIMKMVKLLKTINKIRRRAVVLQTIRSIKHIFDIM